MMKRELNLYASQYEGKKDFFEEMGQILGLPSYCNGNLDNLWDGLTSYIEPNMTIIIYGYQHLLDIFGPEAEGLKDVLEKAPKEGRSLEIICNP